MPIQSLMTKRTILSPIAKVTSVLLTGIIVLLLTLLILELFI